MLAALVLEQVLAAGHTPLPSERRLVVPGDRSIVQRLQETGLLAVYERAGYRIGPPGCSMCLGIASEKANPGEVWITSQNRNYQNRMGAGSLAWLASAAVVAASSGDMKVADPRPWLQRVDQGRYHSLLGRGPLEAPPEVATSTATAQPSAAQGAHQAAPTEPVRQQISSRIQHFGDHIDTDAIIPGEFCHLTDLVELGHHCFHYVAPGFAERTAAGAAVVVAGEGWGSGSSREHAVWALKGAGVRAVIARSFAYIHRRNLVNEAVPHLVLTHPEFHALAADGAEISIELATGEVTVGGRTFQADPTPAIARGLQAAGGIVPAIQAWGSEVFERLTA